MQDDNFSPDWADEGWGEMRQMLDEHLPVRRKRRVAWLPLATIVAVLAFVAFYLLQPAGAVELRAFRVDLTGLAASNTAAPKAPSTQDERNPEIPHSSVNKPTPAVRTVLPVTGLSYLPSDKISTQQNARSTPQPAAQASAQPAQAHPSSPTIKTEQQATLHPLTPSRTLPLTPSPILPFPASPTDLLSYSPPRSHTLGLQATLLASAEQAPDGYTLGGFASISLSPHLYLRGELGWQQSNARRTGRQDTYLFEQSSGPDASSDGWALEASSGVERMRTLNAGLAMGYQLTPRFSVEGGLMYQYLLEAEDFVTWEEAVPTSAPLTEEQTVLLRNLNSTGTVSGDPLQIAMHQYFWQAGLRYRLTHRWSVAMHWQNALRGLFPEEKQKVALQRLGISVGYGFE